MTDEITSTDELGGSDFDGPRSDLIATSNPTGAGIEFTVGMRGYTLSDMEGLIVEAGARLLLGQFGDGSLGKLIEKRCLEQVTAKADAALHAVTHEIIDQPITPAFGDKKPVTMREFIGLTGREYLTERVDRDGKPWAGGSWGGQSFTRIELLVSHCLQKQFKQEIERATNAVISDAQKAVRESHAAILATEKQRLRDAISKLTA